MTQERMLDRERLASSAEYRAEVRFRCQTDHFFLGRMLGYDKFVERIHRPVADLYVAKKPGLPLEAQHDIKNRLHLDPRLTYKTTFGIVDNVQWILIDPDVTMVNETATKPLAKALTDTTTERAFYLPKGKEPTLFQICFPEHCVQKFVSGEYFSPARTFAQPDATMSSTSVDSTQSGWHPWIVNADDPVDTINSGIRASAKVRQSVIDNHNTNLYTLQKGGYVNLRGTRYHPFELWGQTLETMNESKWKVLIRSALRTLDGRRLQAGEFPAEDEMELLFPEILSYDELKDVFNRDYEAFMCQMMNDPQGGGMAKFTVDLYEQSLVQPDRIPNFGETFIHWRFPFAGKDYMKYAEGAAARMVNGHLYIVDAWQGSYTPTGLAEKVVRVCREHQVGLVTAEDSPGARYLEAHIKNESYKKNVSIRLNWIPFDDDDNARFSRIEQLEPMMRSGRLSISTATGKAAEVKRQFVHFGLISENGIIDSISRLAIKIPVSLLRTEIDDEELEAQRKRRMNMESAMVFGAAGQQAMEEQAMRDRMAMAAPRNSYGMPDILGGLDG
jgi:hypothetical protein